MLSTFCMLRFNFLIICYHCMYPSFLNEVWKRSEQHFYPLLLMLFGCFINFQHEANLTIRLCLCKSEINPPWIFTDFPKCQNILLNNIICPILEYHYLIQVISLGFSAFFWSFNLCSLMKQSPNPDLKCTWAVYSTYSHVYSLAFPLQHLFKIQQPLKDNYEEDKIHPHLLS